MLVTSIFSFFEKIILKHLQTTNEMATKIYDVSLKREENIMGTGKSVIHAFLLFPQCFPKQSLSDQNINLYANESQRLTNLIMSDIPCLL